MGEILCLLFLVVGAIACGIFALAGAGVVVGTVAASVIEANDPRNYEFEHEAEEVE